MRRTSAWDPVSALGLENEQKWNSITCTGSARTRGRRCQRKVAASKVATYVSILDRLVAEKGLVKAVVSAELRHAATISLCWQHAGDLEDVVSQWQSKLSQLAIKNERGKSCRNAARGTTSARPQNSTSFTPYASEFSDAPEYGSDDSDERWDASSNKDTEEEIRRRKEKSRQKERERREEEERATRERQKRETQRKRREAQEKEAREQSDRVKERARERAKAEARKTRDMWSSVWNTYDKGWARVTNQQPDNVRTEMIPWPVKSGRWEDVTKASVDEFFGKALPVPESSETGDTRLRLISAENKRWHPDKIMYRFGPDVCNGQYREALAIIARELVRLRQETREGRQI